MAPVDVSSSRFKAGRVGSTAATIFAEMSALAIATDSVNLGQGFPDYDGPAFMLAAAERPSPRASTSTRRVEASRPCARPSSTTASGTTASATTPTPR